MGFERMDKVAREMAARGRTGGKSSPPPAGPTRRASRRSTPVRWASLGLLAAAGTAGALYFVAGGSGKKPALPPKPREAAVQGGGASPSPTGAPPELKLSAADARAARAAQIAVVLDDVDATLHGLRLTWPGKLGSFEWRAPSWITAERLDRELAALDSQLAGASDPLSEQTRWWITVARADGARLFALQAAWSAPGASADAIAGELRPLFDRLVVASQAVHAAVAADAQPPAPGTMAELGASCRVAPLLARLPLRGAAAGAPVVEHGGDPAHVRLAEPPEAELRALSDTCFEAGRAFRAANPGSELNHNDIYQLSLSTQIALNLLYEADRRRDPPSSDVFLSVAGNLAQESSYLAIARRQRDPSLRPAEAEAP